MATEKESASDKLNQPGHAKPARDIVLEHAGEVVVSPHPTAARAPEGKQIHARRPLPLVPTKPGPDSDEGKSQSSNADEACQAPS
jgi:hypothetical protein